MEQRIGGRDLYEMFVAPGVSTADIAAMSIQVLARQVEGLRAEEPDDIGLCDRAIAYLILTYADSCERRKERMDKLTEIAQREGNCAYTRGKTALEAHDLYHEAYTGTLARGERAKELVGTVKPNGADGQYTVGSQSGRAERYTVSLKHHLCHCPDRKNGYYCKHLIASELYQVEQETIATEPEPPAPTPTTLPTPQPALAQGEGHSLAESALSVIAYGERTMLREWLAEHDPTGAQPAVGHNSCPDWLNLVINVARVAMSRRDTK